MATVKKNEPKDVLTAIDCSRALVRFFDPWLHKIAPNLMLFSWEMDFAALTKAGYLIECEIKVSASDWEADQYKDKWKSEHQKYVRRFYYVVPWYLLDKRPDWVPDWMGLLSVNPHGQITIVREAKAKKCEPLPARYAQKLLVSLYYRFWMKNGVSCIDGSVVKGEGPWATTEDQSE